MGETLNKIHEAAYGEFQNKGYQGASLRNIVKQAGVTTGAFYGYYDSKEALFDALVGEQYAYLMELYRKILHSFSQLPPESQKNDMQDYTAQGMTQMTEYIYDHLAAFRLILCCADGTKYEHLIHDLAQLDIEATHEFEKVMAASGVRLKAVNPQLEHMLISGMFSAFFEMVIHDIPREEAREYTSQLRDFYTAGWQKIMGY